MNACLCNVLNGKITALIYNKALKVKTKNFRLKTSQNIPQPQSLILTKSLIYLKYKSWNSEKNICIEADIHVAVGCGLST